MRHLLVVRHAESEWNAAGRWQGWADPPLTDAGRDQARTAGELLRRAGIATGVVITSDLRRAATSAALLAAASSPDVVPVPDRRWREFRVGAWSGMRRTEIEQRWPGALDRYRAGDLSAAPGSEPRAELEDRLQRALADACRRIPTDGTGLVVSHGASLRVLAPLLGTRLPRVTNLSGLDLQVDDEDRPTPVGTVDLLSGHLAGA